VLANVWRALHLRGTPPPVYMQDMGPFNSGFQPWANRSVYLSPKVVQDLRRGPLAMMGPDWSRSPGRGEGLRVLAHEYAHTNQPRVFPRRRFEAGADAYSNYSLPGLSKALGLPPNSVGQSWSYPNFVRALYHSLGPAAADRFVERGQFGR